MASSEEREHDFGRWLQSWRHDNRLTQRQLAATLGYDVSYLVKIEGGARAPSKPFLARLAQVTGEHKETLIQASATESARSPLPCPPDLLIGRAPDVERVISLLTGPARCVTLVGPPGIGKTRLAMEVAAQLAGRFLSGARWVSLLDVNDADQVVAHVRRTLGLTDRTDHDPVAGIIDQLGSQLIVLDNFEHVLAARTLVARLVADAPGIAVLITSREPLGLVSEHQYPITPLAVPDLDRDPSLKAIGSCAAVELFVTRALMAWPRFRLTPTNCEAVARLCGRLDGIPLAIVLAAGLVRTSDSRRIDEQIAQIESGDFAPVDLASHHGTLSTAIAGSWALLSDDERRTFSRLAVFSGGCTVEAASAVCAVENGWRHLASLSRQSLLEARPDDPTGPRFEFLETIRSFARARLDESGETYGVRQRHVAYYVGMARRMGAGLVGPDQMACAEALTADFENLRTAFDWAIVHDSNAALDLAESLWRWMLLKDPSNRWLEQALDAVAEQTPLRAAALAGAGALAWVTGRFDVAARSLDEALALAGDLGLPSVAALSLLNQGALADQLDRFDEADHCFEEALRLYGEVGDQRGRASVLVNQGWIQRRRDNLDGAWPLWIEAAALFRSVGDSYHEARTLANLGRAAEARLEFAEAEEWMDACYRIHASLGDSRGLAIADATLGRISYRRGRYEEASARLVHSLVEFQRLGERRRAVAALIVLSALAVVDDRHYRALRLLGAAEAELGRMGVQLGDDQAIYDEVMDSCRRRVDADAVDRHITFGRGLPLENAVAMFASEKSGSRDPLASATISPRRLLTAR